MFIGLRRILLLTHSMIVGRVEGIVSSAHVCIIRYNERSLGTAASILMPFKCDFQGN